MFVTQAGVVLVDTKLPNNGEAILNQVRTVTDEPVSMIVNGAGSPKLQTLPQALECVWERFKGQAFR